MDAERGQRAGRRLCRILAPTRRRGAGKSIVRPVHLDVKQRAQFLGIHHALHLFERALVAALVTDADDDAPLVTGGEHTHGGIGAERQWLLAEHLLAGRRRGQHLFFVNAVGRRQYDGVDGAVREDVAVSIGQLQRHGVGERADGGRIDIDGANQIDPIAVI